MGNELQSTALAVTTTGPGALQVASGRPLDENPAAVYLAGQKARRAQRAALDTIAAILSGGQADALTLDWSKVRFQHAAAIRAKLAERYAPATVNRHLSALRGTLEAAWKLGQIDAETYRQVADVKGLKAERLPTGRSLTPGEIAALFAACAHDATPAGVRDAAILALLRLGLRRQEVADLQMGNFDRAGETVKVTGKGDKQRLVPLGAGALDVLTDWLTLRGDRPGPLLCQVNKAGRILAEGLTPQAVYNALAKRAELAGVNNLSPHDWRRTFVGDLLDAGADLATVQQLAGHADPKTTARYDRRPDVAKRRAVDRLHIPWQRATLPGAEQGGQ